SDPPKCPGHRGARLGRGRQPQRRRRSVPARDPSPGAAALEAVGEQRRTEAADENRLALPAEIRTVPGDDEVAVAEDGDIRAVLGSGRNGVRQEARTERSSVVPQVARHDRRTVAVTAPVHFVVVPDDQEAAVRTGTDPRESLITGRAIVDLELRPERGPRRI